MGTADILAGLAAIASDWRWLAVTWHVLLGIVVALLIAGWGPSTRLLSHLFIAPLLSVSVLAWLSGNPFNGTTFALLAVTLSVAAARRSNVRIQFARPLWVAPGLALVVFGWMYPHFLQSNTWTPYLYAAPFGLLPCPTLSILIGMSLIVPSLGSGLWNTALVVAGLFYGAVGTFQLGVTIDSVLLFGSAALAVLTSIGTKRSVRANLAECARTLPGDDFIPEPLATITHAITIARPPRDVWPWLVQMGAGNRAGWYSYDAVDNGRRRSATRLMPELQHIAIGTVFPALPGETKGFNVLGVDPCRSLTLGWPGPGPGGEPIVTWGFVLEQTMDGATRLIVRVRGAKGYRFHGLSPRLSKPIIRLVHFVMERKQLLEIAQRVEAMPSEPLLARA